MAVIRQRRFLEAAAKCLIMLHDFTGTFVGTFADRPSAVLGQIESQRQETGDSAKARHWPYCFQIICFRLFFTLSGGFFFYFPSLPIC